MWYNFSALRRSSRSNRFRPWLLTEGCAAVWPNPNQADPDEGLVAVGGDLTAERLLSAYSEGIFPWYEDGTPILWWCPEPRAILQIGNLHVSRSLQRRLRKNEFTLRSDTHFAGVIDGCAVRSEGTWITSDMRAAYLNLHELGYAHSFEVWAGSELVGGLYGLQVGGLFAAESMFHRVTDASKVGLVGAVRALFGCGFELFDVQFETPHLASLGVTVVSREEYLSEVARVRGSHIPWSKVVESLSSIGSRSGSCTNTGAG
jgi:leucyl/phenylalanyl-tRNA--protein transferase